MELEQITQITQKIDLLNLELTNIVPDFKLLEGGIPLSDTNYKYFSIIAKEIKDNLLKEITKALEPLQTDLKKVNDEIERHKELSKFKIRDLDNTVEGLRAKVDNLVIDKNAHANSIDTINDSIENIREDILFRTTYTEFNALVSTVETKASFMQLEETRANLNADIYNCAKIVQLENLEEKVNHIHENSKTLSTIEMMQETTNKLKDWIDIEFKKYLLNEDFYFYKEDVKYDVHNIHEKIDRHESIQGYTNDAFRKEFAQLDKAVKKRPWQKDIEIFRMNLQEAAKIIELQKHKETIVENLDDFKGIMNGFGKRCDVFEKILERFDEVLLDKAAKDDVSEVKKFMKLLAKNEEVEKFNRDILRSFNDVELRFEGIIKNFNKSEELMSQVNASFRNFKSENKDNIQIKNNILDLQNLIESKAEKIDFLSISENIVKRDEVNVIKNNIDVMHRQLEMLVIIGQAVIKTMIKSSDSAVTKNKQRLELLRNIGALLNWVLSSTTFELGSHTNTLQSGIFQKSYQDIESMSLLPSIKQHRKSSISESQNLTSLEIPKFKGKFDI